jgi:hypothetical protein
MPTMASIAPECERTLDLLNLRQMVLTVEEVAKLLEEMEEASKQAFFVILIVVCVDI